MGINANIETKLRDGQIKYQLHSQNNSVLIGKNGHILDSIQTYVRQALLNTLDLYVNITIDVEGYPMNSYERKVVHSALQGFKYVKTESEGEEPNRCVVIKYIENKED